MRVFRSTVFEDESSSARIRLISLIFNKRLNKRFIARTDFFRIIRKVKFPLRQTPSGFFLPLTKANAVQRKFNKPFPTLKIPASFPSFPLRRQILPRVLTFGVNRVRCVAGWRGEQHTSCKFRIHQPRDSMESEAISTFTPLSLSSVPNLFPSIHFTLPALTTPPLNSRQALPPRWEMQQPIRLAD